MRYLIVIPARYGSSRFPGKPLAKIAGVEMIVRVCRQIAKTGIEFVVATDFKEISDCVRNAGFKPVMTSENCVSGTARVAEAVGQNREFSDIDVVINVQGDEPFVSPEDIVLLQEIFENEPQTEIATLVKEFNPEDGYALLSDPGNVKTVISESGDALYFSRNVIPYMRDVEPEQMAYLNTYYIHVGIYAYRRDVLSKLVSLPPSPLEKAENLEQLRWLQNGYRIKTAVTASETVGVDTP